MNGFLRKFSFRAKSPNDKKKSVIKKTSSGLLRFIRSPDHHDDYSDSFICNLPTKVLLSIIDQMSFFEQLRLSRISKDVQQHVDEKMKKIKKLDIKKKDIEETMMEEGKEWQRHFKAYVAIRFEEDTAYMVIDDQWVSGDCAVLLNMIGVFHEWVETVELDAPIAELIVVSMSYISLERWYAFQCIMKAFDNFDNDNLHLDGDFIGDRETYWPRVSELTVRTNACQASHLARVLDYGVKSGYVIDRRNMDKLRIVFKDMHEMDNKVVNRHIYHFRCWAGSLGWDHRYETQFLGGKSTTA